LKNKTKLLYLLLGVLGSQTALAAEEKPIPSDWIPLPYSQSLCGGHYDFMPSEIAFNPEELSNLPISLSADETEFAMEGASHLWGNVTLTQGDRRLHADDIVVKRSPLTHEWDELIAKGNIQFYTPGATVWGDLATYTHSNKHFRITDTNYRWYAKQARGEAHSIEVDKDAILHLHRANYTTCSPLSDTWLLSAKNITLYPKRGRATAEHIRLDLFDVPIFYLPYFNYPIDNKRHSGFLFPSYGSTSNSGYEFSIPYYWNIAPNYDLVVAAKWLSERGAETQTKFRYLWQHGEGILQWHFLPHDRKYGAFSQDNRISPPGGLSFTDPRIVALHGGDSRNAINYRHTSQYGEHWQFNIIFDYVSDDNYLVDLGNDIHIASTIQLPQIANLTYYGENWTHYFNVEEYQVLEPLSKPVNDEIYKRQPQWVFQGTYPDQWLNLTFGLNGEVVNFAHRPDIMTQAPVTIGQRYHLRPSVSFPWQDTWYFLTPRVQVDWLSYDLRLGAIAETIDAPSHPTRTIPLYDVDGGLIYERSLQYKDLHFTQTLEPRIYYLYVPFRDQDLYPNFDSGIINFSYSQLFRDNRFSGRDRVGDTNQITLSLTSRFIPDESGQEWLRASLGEIFYFENRRVFLCEELNGDDPICIISEDPSPTAKHSNLIGQLDFHPNPQWNGGLFWEWNPINQETMQSALNVQYLPSPQKIINFNYYWQKQDFAQFNPDTGEMGSLNQAEISIFWPLTLHWQWLGRWHYDFVQHQTIELLGGVEYNGCCMAFQIVGSRYLQAGTFFYPDPFATGIFAQVVFKGLSAIGYNNPDSKLKQKIPGYTPLYARQQWLTSPKNKPFFPPSEIPLN